MKIRNVRLQNIKSYTDQKISFHEGVNFISGINGAGKSTLIEAVGYALFDYNPGTVTELLRYGAKSGVITVEFCANDEREYRVIRKLGTSSSWIVYDLETESELDLHGARDVREWLKEALGIDRDMELPQLFQDIVGVPQGTFVAPFLEIPSIRKKKFDGILKVEQYREAFVNTSKAYALLKDRIMEGNNRLNILAERVRDYDTVKELISGLQQQVSGLEIILRETGDVIKARETAVRDMEELKTELNRTENTVRVQQVNRSALLEKLKDTETAFGRALEARKLVLTAEKGYHQFVKTDEDLKVLEQKRLAREKLEQELHELQRAVTQLDTVILEKEEVRRKQLEETKNTGEALSRRLEEVAALLEKAGLELTSSKTGLARTAAWKDAEDSLAPVVERFEQITREIELREERRSFLEKEEKQLSELLAELPATEKPASEFEARDNAYQQARKDYAVLDNRLKTLEKNLEQSRGGLCPFLESPCQNVGGSLENYFTGQIEETKNERKKCLDQGVYYKQLREEAEAAQKKLVKLQSDNDRLTQVISQKHDVSVEISCLDEERNTLPLGEKLQSLIDSSDISINLPSGSFTLLFLKEFLYRSRKEREKLEKATAEDINKKSGLAAGLETEYRNAQDNLNKLRLKEEQLTGEKKVIENKRKEAENLRNMALKTRQDHEQYRDLTDLIQETKTVQERLRKDYETYMQNRTEAYKTEALESEKTKTAFLLEKNGTEISVLQDKLQLLRSNFNPDDLADRKRELENMKKDEARDRQVLVERQSDLTERRKQLAQMEKVIKEMDCLREAVAADMKTLNLLDKVRVVLNNAGPPIAKVYLENLSREANELYRRISGENVSLEWREGYDIVLADNYNGRQRERTFRQFSGGEQMTAALAVRLALLKQQSRVRVGFFDEPTANLDADRRINLAETIPHVTGDFHQIFIISHDDTFDSVTDNIIHLRKDLAEGSQLTD